MQDIMDITFLQNRLGAEHSYGLSYLPIVGSTNEEAVRLAKSGAPAWTVVIADEQTAGRGRYLRRWESPAGLGLWFSVILRPETDFAKINLLNLAAALAIADFLELKIEECGVCREARVNLKWPNDVWINDRKICGLLLESGTENNRLKYLVIGIGMNINQTPADFHQKLGGTAVSLRIATGVEWGREEFLADFLKHFHNKILNAIRTDFREIITKYSAKMLYKNQQVCIKLMDNTVGGILQGINEFGYLLLKTETGEKEITTGDVWEVPNQENP